MCSRHQSKYTRSLYLVTNTLCMSAFNDFMRSLGDQWMAQPFSKFMFWYWFFFLVSSCFFGTDFALYSLLQVCIIGALFHLLREATKRKWIPDVTEWKHVDPTTLKTMIHSQTEIMMKFSYAEKHDPPDAAKRANPNYYTDIAQKRAKEEAAWADYTPVNDAAKKRNNERTGGDYAGGANPSPAGGADISGAQARRAEVMKIHADSQAADPSPAGGADLSSAQAIRAEVMRIHADQAADSQAIVPPNARGKRPRAEAGAPVRRVAARGPTCPQCLAVNLTGRFVQLGICGTCTRKNQPKKKK